MTTIDGTTDEWAVPVKFSVSKLMRFGKLPVSLGAGVRYWLDSPPGGLEGWGLVFSMNVILPR